MPGSPRRRARREFAAAQGKTTSPVEYDVEVKPKKHKGQSRERMLELVEIRRQKAAAGDKDALGGRPKTKFTRAEITERALEKLEPHALKVLGQQVKDENLDPADRRAAAIKILEYRRGKPTQAIKVDSHAVNTIRFETAAWIPGMEQSSSASLQTGEILELEAGDVEEVDEDASRDG